MTVKRTLHEREVIVAESITITDHEGDELSLTINYNSTEEPHDGAILEFLITDKGTRGTYVTADELDEMAGILSNVAAGIRVAQKTASKKANRRKRKK